MFDGNFMYVWYFWCFEKTTDRSLYLCKKKSLSTLWTNDKVTKEEAVNAGIKEWNEKYKGMFFMNMLEFVYINYCEKSVADSSPFGDYGIFQEDVFRRRFADTHSHSHSYSKEMKVTPSNRRLQRCSREWTPVKRRLRRCSAFH